MIAITIYAYLNGIWTEQVSYTRPFQGEDKLDETLDSAINDFTLKEAELLLPFTEYKIVANDQYGNAKTLYFLVASPLAEKVRMGG
ncbi:MAG: hypothetical protein K2K85_03745 [Clostridia bacterium]|nr:hypothetical protein [Clostridia bacterium]